jgi:hypothetical protein
MTKSKRKLNIDLCSTLMSGQQVRHGSPHYEVPEEIESITDNGDHVEIAFVSGCFTLMTHDELRELINYGVVDYERFGKHALESMVWIYSPLSL